MILVNYCISLLNGIFSKSQNQYSLFILYIKMCRSCSHSLVEFKTTVFYFILFFYVDKNVILGIYWFLDIIQLTVVIDQNQYCCISKVSINQNWSIAINQLLLYVTVVVITFITIVMHQNFIRDTGFLYPTERCSLRIQYS